MAYDANSIKVKDFRQACRDTPNFMYDCRVKITYLW